MQRHAHGNRSHRMFPDTEMNIAAGKAPRPANHALQPGRGGSGTLKVTKAFYPCKSRGIQVSRTASQLRDFRRDGLHHRFRCFTGGDIF